MDTICLYFQVHQPLRLRRYTVFDIGKAEHYFDDTQNRQIMKRVAENCYLPMNELLLKLIRQYPDRFRVAFSITGIALEQFREYAPDVLASFKKLADTGNVEFLGETYHHSLASLFSETECAEQVRKHRDAIKDLFGIEPTVFRNTELILSNGIARLANELGFTGILGEGAESVLGTRKKTHVYTTQELPTLLRHYRYADDIAFRFSDKDWEHWPLSPKTYAGWLRREPGDVVNLFMDYETFGEHQAADTGIFTFFEKFVATFMQDKNASFVTPSQAIDRFDPAGDLDVLTPTSWADRERDVSAWMGNKMQNATLKNLYMLEKDIRGTDLVEKWRKVQCSDHFYYMCVKYYNDGDVHSYFNPYDSPYEAFIAVMNIITDMTYRLREMGVGCEDVDTDTSGAMASEKATVSTQSQTGR